MCSVLAESGARKISNIIKIVSDITQNTAFIEQCLTLNLINNLIPGNAFEQDFFGLFPYPV